MRVNGVMGVIAVACVVAVVNGAALGPMGRLHHRSHGRAANNRRLTGMELVGGQAPSPPPTPALEISAPRLHRGGFVTLPKGLPDDLDDIAYAPEVLLPAFVIATEARADTQPHADAPPPISPPPALPTYASFRSLPSLATPEPATWAMMVLGFGVIGAALRRRRRDAADIWRGGHGRTR
jgi:hypothetical protein